MPSGFTPRTAPEGGVGSWRPAGEGCRAHLPGEVYRTGPQTSRRNVVNLRPKGCGQGLVGPNISSWRIHRGRLPRVQNGSHAHGDCGRPGRGAVRVAAASAAASTTIAADPQVNELRGRAGARSDCPYESALRPQPPASPIVSGRERSAPPIMLHQDSDTDLSCRRVASSARRRASRRSARREMARRHARPAPGRRASRRRAGQSRRFFTRS